MTAHGDIPMSVRAIKGGAVDFLAKPFRDQDMLDAVQSGLAQDRARRKTANVTVQLRSAFDSLTPREQEIMKLVTAGMMNKQIAGEIGVSEVTVGSIAAMSCEKWAQHLSPNWCGWPMPWACVRAEPKTYTQVQFFRRIGVQEFARRQWSTAVENNYCRPDRTQIVGHSGDFYY
jgi:DNA-binding CsgD family transcriptional regulator